MKSLRKSEQFTRDLTLVNRRTRLTASAGIAANVMLSKVCSGIIILNSIHSQDLNKPNGQYFLAREESAIKEFLATLPIRKVPGIISDCIFLIRGRHRAYHGANFKGLWY